MGLRNPSTSELTPTQEAILTKLVETVRLVLAAPIRDVEKIQKSLTRSFAGPRGLSDAELMGLQLVLEALEDVENDEPEQSMWEAQTNALARRRSP